MSSYPFARVRSAVFVSVVLFGMYCFMTTFIELRDTDGKLQSATGELDRLKKENAMLAKDADRKLQGATGELDRLKNENAGLVNAIQQLQGNVASLQSAKEIEIGRLKDENAMLANETRHLHQTVARLQSSASSTRNGHDNDLSNLICHGNPYYALQEKTLRSVSIAAWDWLQNLTAVRQMALEQRFKRGNWDRFFPFQEMAPCADKTCVGGPCGDDRSKIVCELGHLKKKGETSEQREREATKTTSPCVIYSVGGNNLWQFEVHLSSLTPCEIHTFDCTGNVSRFTVPGIKNIHFHHVCLGTEHEDARSNCTGLEKCGETWTLLEIQRRLGHKRIDLFKMDIEGWEWPLLESWPRLDDGGADQIILPMQVLVEIHYRSQFSELTGIWGYKKPWNRDWKFASDIVDLQEHLIKVGYTVAVRDDNRRCPVCTELTLIRTSCPSTGVYFVT